VQETSRLSQFPAHRFIDVWLSFLSLKNMLPAKLGQQFGSRYSFTNVGADLPKQFIDPNWRLWDVYLHLRSECPLQQKKTACASLFRNAVNGRQSNWDFPLWLVVHPLLHTAFVSWTH
jgi:hypothetical protein